MEIITRIPRMASIAREMRGAGKRIGLVATRGSLHEGHLSLMGAARDMCDTVIVSILASSPQPDEESERSSADLARDAELAFTRGVDFIFAPALEELSPPGELTRTVVNSLGEKLEGGARPGHFGGVTTILNKLLNI